MMRPFTPTRRRAWALAFGALLLGGQLALLVHVSAGLAHDQTCPVCQVAHTPAMSSPVQPGLAPAVYGDAPASAVDVTPAFQPTIVPSQRGPPAVDLA